MSDSLNLFYPKIQLKMCHTICQKENLSIKKMSKIMGYGRMLSSYLTSYLISFPPTSRFQINMSTFLHMICGPPESIGNILIIQGGVLHMNSESHYIKLASMFVQKDIRAFVFEKLYPALNPDYVHDIADCARYIRNNYNGPLVIIGYSMGGLFLYTYLSNRYDQADLYIPTCCPLDLGRFYTVIKTHPVFKYIQRKVYSAYHVDNDEDLMRLSNYSLEKHKKFVSNFPQLINSCCDQWIDKTIYVLSSNDPITEDVENQLRILEKRPLTYVVQGGWHCCIDSIYLSVILACNYIRAVHNGVIYKVDEIPTD